MEQDHIEPVVPPKEGNRDVHETARNLESAIKKGKLEVPEQPAPLVCKPTKLESWRVFKIMAEFVEGFETIGKYGLAVSFFGSARATFEDHFYKDATELAGRLAKRGFAVITGGSAGIMEAANRGAYEAGGASIGLNISLEDSQGRNKYLTDYVLFDHFFVRKVMLTFASEAYVYFPGGFGTLDEFFEIITLIQTEKIKRVPIVCYGKEYWEPIVSFFKTKLYEEHRAISETDFDLFAVVDTADEAYDYIIKNARC
ncbi:MAG: TIGR00730 family Rossman fold protein [Minisyncoccia bacterium]